jgi:hypothetical protein
MKKNIEVFICCSLLLACYLTGTGCNSKGNTTQTKDTVVTHIKKYTLPENLALFLTSPVAGATDSTALMAASFKLIVTMDFSCPVCISEVDKWNDFYEASLKTYQVPMILLCQSHDKYRYMKYLFSSQKLKGFPFPLLLDLDTEGVKLNTHLLTETGKMKAVLIDAGFNILYAGLPMEVEKDRQDLIKAIASVSQTPHQPIK